ncbi:CASP-like protein 4D1 isoform X2 [Rosa chinensis]|uniref:CASP-like protein 4D1 isoform X2 n=1 Tax=Rosa chinensis TaxID=74649 RepID=UPI001AD915C5|nr:CASP-like protein 4D1 isoform X2 [Rosa chinensis]
MAFMLSPGVSRIVTIVLRVLAAIVLFVSLVMLVANNQDYPDPSDNGNTKTARFYDQVGFQYMAATTALGIGFSIYGTVVVALRIKRGNDEGNLLIDFYGQKLQELLQDFLRSKLWKKLSLITWATRSRCWSLTTIIGVCIRRVLDLSSLASSCL